MPILQKSIGIVDSQCHSLTFFFTPHDDNQESSHSFDDMDCIKEKPVAVFKSRFPLLVLNVLPRILFAAVAVMLAYFGVAFLIKSIRTDPGALFFRYWPYWLLLCVLLAVIWTLWFDIVTIYAYKTKMVICKRGKCWTFDYDSIISFTWERTVIVLIPLPVQKTIIATGNGKVNRVKSCSCISKQDFFHLHHISNTNRPAGYEIPMKRSTQFHT